MVMDKRTHQYECKDLSQSELQQVLLLIAELERLGLARSEPRNFVLFVPPQCGS